jgi:hypothetical protein
MQKGLGKNRRKPAKLDDGHENASSLRFLRGFNRAPPCQKGYQMKSLALVLVLASAGLSLAVVAAVPAAAGSDEACLLRDCSAG